MAPLSFLLVLLIFIPCPCLCITYNTSAGPVPGKLNVHLIAHTHDDVGWLKTVDQYYTGQNNSLAGAAVELILDTVISNLQDNPDRKFIYVEQAFFQRWWRDQTLAKQTLVKKLVDNGQLEFVNGGWCMHDEATTHYIDMIDQTTFGHRFIKEQFGKYPRIGWQIDPFGHSAVQAYLLGSELGFDALYFARIDYQDRKKRMNMKSLESIWQASNSLGSLAQIFTGVFLRHYSPPDGFEFETGAETVILQDDPLLFDYNVKESVDAFVAAAEEQAQFYRSNHIMFTMGDDFTYQNARSWFREMDKIIHYVNLDGRVNTFYSTPSIYTDAKFAANITWPLKSGDFFPYADEANAYWTGYFTSRAGLKGYVRMLSGYYLAARQLEFLVGKNTSGANTDALGEALAVLQHHDGVSGTEKQHVANDYAKRLDIGASRAAEFVNTALTCLTSQTFNSSCQPSEVMFQQCPLLNISYCPESEQIFSEGKSLVVIAYNSLGWNRTDFIRIPVSEDSLEVTDADGNAVPAQLTPIDILDQSVREFYTKAYLGVYQVTHATSWLVIQVTIPAFGYNTYYVSKSSKGGVPKSSVENSTGNGTIVVGPGYLQLSLSSETGQLTRMTNNETGADLPLQQSYLWYGSYDGADGQASGAYIFRPNGAPPSPIARKVSVTIARGALVDEVYQEFSPWVKQVIRTYKDKEHAEFEFVVGPIPYDDGIGKEIITRLTTSIVSTGAFYTDSNGRDFLQRVRDSRPDWTLQVTQPVAGNYYPVNLGMYIKDSTNEFSVLVDRSVGGSSIKDGQIELMLHRLLLHDDGRGVGEALQEQVCVDSTCEALMVKGKYYASVHPANNGSRWRRSTGQEIFSPLLLAFSMKDSGIISGVSSFRSSFSAVAPGYTLPDNVAMITLQELDDKSVLLRLAHLFEVDEDPDLSTVATVNLNMLFSHKLVRNVTEMSLSANQVKEGMREPLPWQTDGGEAKGKKGRPLNPSTLLVELAPMEIRTFLLHF